MKDFEALYARHMPAVFRYALRSVGRREIAEEITADAFLALYRNLDGIDVAQLPAWLLTVVRHRAVDYWRRSEIERGAMAAAAVRQPPMMPAPAELEVWLIESCKDLKPVHRACLLLRFVHGMTRAEIAVELGLTENQVKGSLQYALELLRKALPRASAHGVR